MDEYHFCLTGEGPDYFKCPCCPHQSQCAKNGIVEAMTQDDIKQKK